MLSVIPALHVPLFMDRIWLLLFKYVLSTMGVSKESISKFLIGNRFHVKLCILSPYSNRMSRTLQKKVKQI